MQCRGECRSWYTSDQACNQTEQTEQRVCLGSARWLACSVRLARWPILAAQARLGSAKQPNRLLRLGLAKPNQAARLLVHPWLLIGYRVVTVPRYGVTLECRAMLSLLLVHPWLLIG